MLRLHLGSEGDWVGFLERNLPLARGIVFCKCLRPVFPFAPLSSAADSSVTSFKAQGSYPKQKGKRDFPSLFGRKEIMVLLSFNVQQRKRI